MKAHVKEDRRRHLRRKPVRVLSVIVVFVLAALTAACSGNAKEIRMGTARIGGNYYSFGITFAQFLMDDIRGVDVQVKATTGSGANLRMITQKEPEIELALLQADVISELADKSDSSPGFGAIAGLYTEAVQLVVRADSGIREVSDLEGRVISVGEAESGTEKNALMVLSAYGIDPGTYTCRNLNYAGAAHAMEDGSIDAFFCTMGTPATVIGALAQKVPISLLDISGEEAESILDTYSFFSSYTIPAGTYTGLNKDVKTIGVKSVLVASDTLSAGVVKKITQSFFDHAAELRYAVTVDYKPDPAEAVKDLPIALHEGARAWYKENKIQ